MDMNLFATQKGKTFKPFKVVNFDMQSAEILKGDMTVKIHYDPQAGWIDQHGNQYRVTSKPQSFSSLRLV